MTQRWTTSDPRWLALSPYQRAALMSLMERQGNNTDDALHIIGAMVNRAKKSGADLGEHVGERIYQPSFEPSQEARIDRLLKSPDFQKLATFAQDRWEGRAPDNVSGATHYLAPESTMLALERREPSKYRNWGPRGANWTGYDPSTGSYRGVVLRDGSHAFLAPEGRYSDPGAPFQTADATPPILKSGVGREPAPTTQPNAVGSPSAAPFSVASNGPPSSATPAAASDQGGAGPFSIDLPTTKPKTLGQSFGENLASAMSTENANRATSDTSLLQRAMADEEARRKAFALSPFELARMV